MVTKLHYCTWCGGPIHRGERSRVRRHKGHLEFYHLTNTVDCLYKQEKAMRRMQEQEEAELDYIAQRGIE